MKKENMPVGKMVTMKNIPASQIGKMVADHGMNKVAMCDKMASVRASKGKK